MTNQNTTNAKNMKHNEIIGKINAMPARSAWERGVKQYAIELVEDAESIDQDALLNGARDWSAYSYGGCTLIYDRDIAERLCTPSWLKRTKNGARQPNSRETWLDVQTRALHQAAALVARAASA